MLWLVAIILCAQRVVGSAEQVYTDLYYATHSPMTNCSDLQVCADTNCQIVPKNISVQVEVNKVIENETETDGWTCVQMETVDGLCENGMMQKAIVKQRKVMVEKDAETCHSNAEPVSLMARDSYYNYLTLGSKPLNDRCKAKGKGTFECDFNQQYSMYADYLVGGYEGRNARVNSYHSRLVNVTYNKAHDEMQVVDHRLNYQFIYNFKVRRGNQSLTVNGNKLGNEFSWIPYGRARHLFDGQMRDLKDRFLADSAESKVDDVPLPALGGSFTAPTMRCYSNNLCKRSNCDRIQKSRQVQRSHTQWCKASIPWGTWPPAGYHCLNKKFTGCDCKKTWQETEYYYVDRSAICQHNVQTSVKPSQNGKFTIKMDSLFNNCAMKNHTTARCKADVRLDYNIAIESGNNKDNAAVSTIGEVSFDMSIHGNKKTVQSNMNVTKHSRYESAYSNFLFGQNNALNNQLTAAVRSQIVALAEQQLNKDIVGQFHEYEFKKNAWVRDDNSSSVNDYGTDAAQIDTVQCGSNIICNQNCDLKQVEEDYTVNLNKTVEEDDQLSHENHGWNCKVTLNNVSRCANDLYAQNQTEIDTIYEEANVEVCRSGVSPIVQLGEVRIAKQDLISLKHNCQSSMNGTEQQVLCQNLVASAKWSFNMTAGGNTMNYDVQNDMLMSIVVDVTHDLHESDDKEAEYNISQRENDDGVNHIVFTNPSAVLKGVESEEWFKGMVDLVRSKAR